MAVDRRADRPGLPEEARPGRGPRPADRGEPGATPEEAYVRHHACPWHRWHDRNGLLAEDRPGCDEWFRATCETVSQATGRRVRFETLEALPDGGKSCLRRIWVER